MRVFPRNDVRILGLLTLLIGIWGGIVPFAGPDFGFYMGAHTAAWTWNASHAELHVGPAVAAAVGGLMMAVGVRRPMQSIGALLAIIGGVWFVIGPSIYPVWAGAGMMGMHSMHMMGAPTQSTGMRALEAVGYHYGTGAAIAVLASVAFGLLLATARAVAPSGVAARPRERRPAFAPTATQTRAPAEPTRT